jgi:hypothetical protein
VTVADQATRFGHVRSVLERSTLVGGGGALLTRLLDPTRLGALREDAFARHAEATEMFVADPCDEDIRRGDPDRWLEWAVGGPALQAFSTASATLDLLARVTGVNWTPSGPAGTYSYYRRPGHHLGLHRDVDDCDLTIITNLYERGAQPGSTAGCLRLYPERTSERLDTIRSSSKRGAVHLRLQPGQSLIMLGGRVPHRLLPVADGQARIVAPLCYRVAGPAAPPPPLSFR